MEVIQNLIRCHLKISYKEKLEQLQKTKELYERLRKKNPEIFSMSQHPSEEELNQFSGHNEFLKFIYLLAHAENGKSIKISDRHKILYHAITHLKREASIELKTLKKATVLTNQPSSFVCPAPSFVRRTPTSITVTPNHMVSDNMQIIP